MEEGIRRPPFPDFSLVPPIAPVVAQIQGSREPGTWIVKVRCWEPGDGIRVGDKLSGSFFFIPFLGKFKVISLRICSEF